MSTFSCLSKRKWTEREGHQRGECFDSFPSLDSPLSATKERAAAPSLETPQETRSSEGRSKRGTAHGSLLCRFKDGGPGGRENEIPSPGRAFSFFHFLFARAKRKWNPLSRFSRIPNSSRAPIGLRPLPPVGEARVGLDRGRQPLRRGRQLPRSILRFLHSEFRIPNSEFVALF